MKSTVKKLIVLLALSFVACGEEKTKTNEGTKTPVVDPGNNTETPTPVVPSGNTETPTPVVVKEVASIEVDQDSVDAVLKEEIFNYHNILIVVTYADGTTENLNLDDSMLSEAELSKITAFGRKKIEVTFGGKSCSFSINIPRSSLYGIEVNEESLKAALSADYFDFTSINIDLVYTNNTRTSMPLASSMFTMREIAELYTAGDKSFTINYSGKTTTLEYKNDKDLIKEYYFDRDLSPMPNTNGIYGLEYIKLDAQTDKLQYLGANSSPCEGYDGVYYKIIKN